MRYVNNVNCALASEVNVSSNSIKISEAKSPFKLPPVNGAIVTLTDSLSLPTAFEVIRYESMVDNGDGTYLLNNVLRGQQGTDARAWTVGDAVFQGLTAEVANQLEYIDAKEGDVLVAGNKYRVAPGITVSLPAAPTVSDEIYLFPSGDWSSNPPKLIRNGELIWGKADDLVLNSNLQIKPAFKDAVRGWEF